MTDIAVIILAGKEEVHVRRCLTRLAPLEPRQIFIIESQKGDRTHEIAVETARSFGWQVDEGKAKSGVEAEDSTTLSLIWHAWPGLYATQFNWALDNCPVSARWVLRMDADEYLSQDTIEKLKSFLTSTSPLTPDPSSDEVTAFTLELRRVFVGGVIHYGTTGIRAVRIWRTGCCRIEEREMDEHMMVLCGKTADFDGAFYDDTLQTFKEWQAKHYVYARKEAANYFKVFCDIRNIANPSPTDVMKVKYYKWPYYVRGLVYFGVRYFKKGGFLDGLVGWRWHFWQGYWYRFLVDMDICKTKKVPMAVDWFWRMISCVALSMSLIVLSPLILVGFLLPRRQ